MVFLLASSGQVEPTLLLGITRNKSLGLPFPCVITGSLGGPVCVLRRERAARTVGAPLLPPSPARGTLQGLLPKNSSLAGTSQLKELPACTNIVRESVHPRSPDALPSASVRGWRCQEGGDLQKGHVVSGSSATALAHAHAPLPGTRSKPAVASCCLCRGLTQAWPWDPVPARRHGVQGCLQWLLERVFSTKGE